MILHSRLAGDKDWERYGEKWMAIEERGAFVTIWTIPKRGVRRPSVKGGGRSLVSFHYEKGSAKRQPLAKIPR